MRDWRGLIALVLAVGVSLALLAGVLTAELTPSKVTSEEIAFLSTLGGASVGAVAAYLGHRPNQRSDDMTEVPDPTTEPEPTEPEPTEPTEPKPTPGPLVDPDEPLDPGTHEVDTPTLDDGEVEDVGPDTDE